MDKLELSRLNHENNLSYQYAREKKREREREREYVSAVEYSHYYKSPNTLAAAHPEA